jgi:hypothetical protein
MKMLVWPKDDEMRKLLQHEPTGVPFYETGPADWPDDTFTYRRIQDGDVLTSPPAEKDATAAQPAEKKSVKAAARPSE